MLQRFPPTSRYHGIETAELETPAGGTIVYLRRRFVPPPEHFDLLLLHTVSDGDRLDIIAAQHLGDPEQAWRIADANAALDRAALTADVGRRLRITLPEGVPGVPRA